MNANEVKKDLYKSKKMAKLSHYVSGNMYYTVELADGIYQFTISTIEDTEIEVEIPETWKKMFTTEKLKVKVMKLSSDLGTTTFEAEMKGSDLNRWISKAIDKGEFIKIA